MLILFDIDATLITTSRTGILAMADAGRELYGQDFSEAGVDFAGRLDPLILADLLRKHGHAPTRENVERFRAAYRRHLGPHLARPGVARALPGVQELVSALRGTSGVCIGLLTGNYADTGSLKLRAAGIDPGWFPVQVWGDDSPHDPPSRDHLPPVGLRRHREVTGLEIAPDRAVIIGDTPHDVRCALAHGLRALGVGTGMFTPAALEAAGAHRAVPNLADTQEVLRWLTAPPAR
jgi:phosphoglycolate phosphatase-like HAD superfamily hydrolase